MPQLKLYESATAIGIEKRTVAKITRDPVGDNREDYFLLVDEISCDLECHGYAGVITKQTPNAEIHSIPRIGGFENVEFLKPGYIISVEPNGFTHILYRPESHNNVIFATGRCNSNCLMCSQPPKDSIETGWLESHLRSIDLINDNPETLGISGGEPTLLGDDLVIILERISSHLPNTSLFMLTNGRQFDDEQYVKKIAAIPGLNLLSAIPLYADVAPIHDYIVQAKGAFDQTAKGLYNMARHKLPVEIRVVLHKQTIPRLLHLMEFIYRNFPFVAHVALMGLENMGYVKKNWELLWIDPVDYPDDLEAAVRYLHYRGMPVSIYNLQLCILKPTLHPFARKSISDFKNIYLEECSHCSVRNDCAGLFKSSETRHSRGIKTLPGKRGVTSGH